MVKRRTVTQEKVIETAVALANEVGDAHAITLKQVADALDIKVPSLYNHVKGAAGLLAALRHEGQRLLLRQLRDGAFGLSGEAALTAVAHSYRQFAHQNRGIYMITQQAPAKDDAIAQQNATEMIQLFSLLLASYNLEGDGLIHAIRGYRALLHGFVSLEMAQGFGLPLDVDESFATLVETYLAGLSG